MFASIKSVHGNKCGHIFLSESDFMLLVPMMTSTGLETSEALLQFVHEVGVPRALHSNGAAELTTGE
jgi:hypothetical protein